MNEEDLHARLLEMEGSIRELKAEVVDAIIELQYLRKDIQDLLQCMPDLETIVQDTQRRERMHAGGQCP